MKTLLCTLILATLGTAAAKADSIVTISFDQPDQVATAGDYLEFFGTITNDTDSTIYLNADDPNLAGNSLSINDQFYNTVPLELDPGASSGDIELFDVLVSDPLVDAAGLYSGEYTLFGGVDGDAQDNLGSASFSVDTAPLSGVPEPSSIYLLLSGAGAAILPLTRRLRNRVA